MNLDLTKFKVSPFVLIFLKDGDKVLFLKRSTTKQIFPGKISGIGGKVEPGETIEESARREFQEETGLSIKELRYKGVFTGVVLDKGFINVNHIFLAIGYSGELKTTSDEGVLFWEDPEKVARNPDLVNHVQHHLLIDVDENSDLYCGVGVVDNWELIQYTDNRQHFQDRKNK
ncbi:hypothetical protein A3D85_00085 [Candidatus Amesbacteria bacterium RIFCSPHIGHO2_02_FULL_47_9]|uniref:Nudix hydrolase domain-containing protein n=1 Tax=Candidatus Amesbacteria bacterium RIFCSPHIGHO2_01_FULL_48_32b TaxID=1797253 RepID=A0A1F4YGH3_9BACT|nr:MAG: hypothetical protein A2876_00840 [Candidatus Amesbacteria bacterium RIFCSPHIGHO2_01_FULL_48_32b]OGD03185.1 MAG: hypothetical protein A3D85_00085 [Candidatus Amesbacteria bacterium RIFCSPHIGHO2_02_FULL_47_9]OGD07437.1 MAG: hypothetical protein A2899_03995 [Candidatus Amesbacteria bacterium RIFCSPLOWO2_01_FULL_49_25]